MTDDEIMKYATQQQAKGTSQTDIAKQLVAKGATVAQLQKLREKFSSSSSKSGTGNSVSDSRLRLLNGYDKSITSTRKDTMMTKLSTGKSTGKENTYGKLKGKKGIFIDEDGNVMVVDEEEEEPKIFGQNIFCNENLSFEPNVNVASPADYQLGAGDELIIDIYGASQKTIRAEVSPDGNVIIEEIGPVRVGGLDLEQANKRINSILGARYQSSQISVTLGNMRTIVVNVMGEVVAPGTYTLSGFASVFHALYVAGGVNDIGTLRDIKIYRNNKLEAEVDVYDYILNGQMSGDIRLSDNDVILVGSYVKHVDVSGFVKRPMIYELKDDETMGTLLSYAGGFDAKAYTRLIRVIRKTDRDRAVFNVSEDARDTFVMQDGDEVEVDSILDDRYTNTVEIKGAVFHPGLYQIGDEIKTVRQLVEFADGVTEQAFTTRAVMHRMKPNRTLEVLSVDLEGILSGSAADIELRENDILFIPTIEEARETQTITIYGEVLKPGVYSYADNETLEDFILQAGGLLRTASTVKVDVARRKVDPAAESKKAELAETFSFTLKEGFVVDGTPGFTLMPFDEVFVRKSPGTTSLTNVTIVGEVLYPGSYTLPTHDCRLSDIVAQAGGISDFAYAEGAYIVRTRSDEEVMRMQTTKDILENRQNSKDEEVLSDINDTIFILGIKLHEALANRGGEADIILQEDDIISVPTTKQTVSIAGNVNFPLTTTYIKGKKSKYYINMAGGYGSRAKKRAAFAVYMNGNAAKAKRAEILPGTQIVVPTKETEKWTITQWLALGTSAASLATMFATIASLCN